MEKRVFEEIMLYRKKRYIIHISANISAINIFWRLVVIANRFSCTIFFFKGIRNLIHDKASLDIRFMYIVIAKAKL